jgi:DNA topoisomerase-1
MSQKQEGVEVKERLCPKCEGKLVPRTSRFGPFHGCSNYPKCRHVEKE